MWCEIIHEMVRIYIHSCTFKLKAKIMIRSIKWFSFIRNENKNSNLNNRICRLVYNIERSEKSIECIWMCVKQHLNRCKLKRGHRRLKARMLSHAMILTIVVSYACLFNYTPFKNLLHFFFSTQPFFRHSYSRNS